MIAQIIMWIFIIELSPKSDRGFNSFIYYEEERVKTKLFYHNLSFPN